MKNVIIGTLITLALTASSTLAIAGSHSKYSGKGYSAIQSQTALPGQTGTIMHFVAKDFWDWDPAPEGWPNTQYGTCHQTVLLSTENVPLFIRVTCESVDGEGDAAVWAGSVDPATGEGTGNLMAGTGKYAGVELEINFRTILQIDANHSVYEMKN